MNGGKRETNTMDGTQEAATGEKSIHGVNYTNRTRKCFMSYRLVCIFIMRDTKEWDGCASRVNESITDLTKNERPRSYTDTFTNSFNVLTFSMYRESNQHIIIAGLQSTAIIAVPVLVNVTRATVLVV